MPAHRDHKDLKESKVLLEQRDLPVPRVRPVILAM
jgi:hypothetical protein